jgi:hypothetical protein
VACSPISQQAREDLAKPINCSTGRDDIRVLHSEKAHVASQILAGVTAIQPASAVLSVATGTEKDKLEVASGEYNRMIDDKIATIK